MRYFKEKEMTIHTGRGGEKGEKKRHNMPGVVDNR